MRNSTGSTFASTFHAYIRRIAARMNQSANERLSLQLGNSPVAVLGVG
ncbi:MULTISPECIES: hypothetical protein [Gordonia]|uniref:Uncharacterized protein n=1 Tax=Gordonia cholesterolivorans TaxID=559625 RepID=A0ABP5UND9_9ACTN|nr:MULTISPECIES: hypothetical protein [Gordonia]WFN94845.1 hypothetical protein P5P27_10130 [Gordonia sihwensis]